MREWANLIAGVLYALAFIPLLLAVWYTRKMPAGAEGKMEPERVTWTVWAVIDSIIFAGMYARSSVNGQITGALVGIWIVTAFAWKYGRPGRKTRDKVCLVLSIAGLVLWQLLATPEIGIVAGLASGCIAAWPMMQESWQQPGKEPWLSKLGWITFSVGGMLQLVAVPTWDVANAAPPIVFGTLDIVITYLVMRRPRLFVSAS